MKDNVEVRGKRVTEAVLGMWINADAVRSVEIVAPHARKVTDGGWSIDVESAGQIVVTTREGERQIIEVDRGDRLSKCGDEFELAVRRTRKG